MMAQKQSIHLVLDGEGMVEVVGIGHGEKEAARVAAGLGLGDFTPVNFLYTAIRSGPLSEEKRVSVKAKAAELGYPVEEVESLKKLGPAASRKDLKGKEAAVPEASTISVIHEHEVHTSRGQKLVLPLVILAVVAALVAVGGVIRDHLNHSYTLVRSLSDVVQRAQHPGARQGTLSRLINPDDSRYVSVLVNKWPYWMGKSAVVGTYYIRIPGLREPSIESMVKGERGGAAPILFRMDAGRRDGVRYALDSIVRGGIATPDRNLEVEIYPIRLGNRPPLSATGEGNVYQEGAGIRYERDRTFRGVTRLAVPAFALRADSGYRLKADHFAVAIEDGIDPGLDAVVRDLVVSDDQIKLLDSKKLDPAHRMALNKKKATWFLDLKETFPWKEGQRAGRRQLLQEIGRAHLDGVLLGKLYIENTAS